MAPDTPSDDEKKLFQDAMRSVIPLKSAPTKADTRPTPKPSMRPPNKSRDIGLPHRESGIASIYLSDVHHDDVRSDTCLSYCVTAFPKKRLIELRQGRIPYHARLDLHRLTVDQAKKALIDCLHREEAGNHRCFLLIHGKGGHNGESPVLKNHVNHWLKQLPDVLAFHSALPKDGGNGALYVLLRRHDKEDT